MRKYSGALKNDIRYLPTTCFLTFPFPRDPAHEAALAAIGEAYHEHRRALMRDLWLGLTDLYNLFHRPDLTADLITAERGDRATIPGTEGFTRLLRLRELHLALDAAVLAAYGWDRASDFGPAPELRHDFHALDNLPENDRTRYTLHPEARREVLARLLKLNHQRPEQAATAPAPLRVLKPAKKPKPKSPARQHSKGINFKRGAIAAYAVERLCDRTEFGRTQMEKVLYGAQYIVGEDLEWEDLEMVAGPFDPEIHKLESLANKQGWFFSKARSGHQGASYSRGPNIELRCGAARAILGDKLAEFDRVLDWFAKMNTERAELWMTVHAAWRKLLHAGETVTDGRIVQAVYAWNPSKLRFTEERIRNCIQWMRDENFAPRVLRFESQKPSTQDELGLFQDEVVAPPTLLPALREMVGHFDFNIPQTRRARVHTAAELFTVLLPALVQEAGGTLAYRDLLAALSFLAEPPSDNSSLPPPAVSAFGQWSATFSATLADPNALRAALHDLIVMRHALNIRREENGHTLFPGIQWAGITHEWTLLDARLALSHAASATSATPPWREAVPDTDLHSWTTAA